MLRFNVGRLHLTRNLHTQSKRHCPVPIRSHDACRYIKYSFYLFYNQKFLFNIFINSLYFIEFYEIIR